MNCLIRLMLVPLVVFSIDVKTAKYIQGLYSMPDPPFRRPLCSLIGPRL